MGAGSDFHEEAFERSWERMRAFAFAQGELGLSWGRIPASCLRGGDRVFVRADSGFAFKLSWGRTRAFVWSRADSGFHILDSLDKGDNICTWVVLLLGRLLTALRANDMRDLL